MAKKSIIPDVIAAASNRRSFVRKLSIASAAAGAVFTVGPEKAGAAPPPNDIDIFNFALNLEYLEAEFYTKATTGKTIDQPPYNIDISGTGNPGPTTGGSQVALPDSPLYTSTIAQQIANDERNHVNVLRSALGKNAIAKPEINLDAAGFGFADLNEFLKLARMFEDIGVSAYAAAAPLLPSKQALAFAARILAVEGEHVANLRLQMAKLGVASKPMDSVDIIPPPSGTLFFSVDPRNGLPAVRTPGQVLYLAYGNLANAASGGFFPNGVNGNITESSGPA